MLLHDNDSDNIIFQNVNNAASIEPLDKTMHLHANMFIESFE